MSTEQHSPDDDALFDQLVSYDEALADGDTMEIAVATPQNTDQESPLARLQACLRRLEIDRRARQPRVAAQTPAPDQGPPIPHLRQIGRFTIVRFLGGGGNGLVYLATDSNLKRDVALKVPRPETFLTPELRSRFVREGQAVAPFKHPNLVPVHEAGEANAIPYLVSEYCPGGTLADRLRNRRGGIGFEEAAELIGQLAAGVQYIHDNQVIHRDLKPGNILFDDAGIPRITDFGLAKMMDADWTQTQSNAVLGTASYMAPEQAGGKSKTVGRTADVYALGAILYELLTGQAPFRGASLVDIIEQVRTKDPQKPRAQNPKVPRDLEYICLKCLEKKPEWRYPSAAALGVDLRKWLDGEPIHAEPLWRRVARQIRRRPRAIVALGLVLLTAIIAHSVARYRDPERPRWEMEDKLARGQAVTLIGETGMPAWFRWVGPKGVVDARAERGEGPFAFRADGEAFLELCANPQSSNYKFEADIWHKNLNDPNGLVGIYFLHHPLGGDHSFCAVTFKEFVPKSPDVPFVAQAAMTVCVRREAVNERTETHAIRGMSFIPALGSMVWRHLKVEVRPKNVRAFWGKDLVCAVTTEDLYQGEAQLVDRLPHLQSVAADFSPQAPLGILLMSAEAAFRNIKICPLEPE